MRTKLMVSGAVDLLTAAVCLWGVLSSAAAQEGSAAPPLSEFQQAEAGMSLLAQESAPAAVAGEAGLLPQPQPSTVWGTEFLVTQQDISAPALQPVVDPQGTNPPAMTPPTAAPATTGFESIDPASAGEAALSPAERTVDLWEGGAEPAAVEGTTFSMYEDPAVFDDVDTSLPVPVEEEAESEVILTPEPLGSQWDFALLDSPLFGTEQITEFSRQQIPVDGNWRLRPTLSVATVYDGNIFISEDDQEADYIVRAAPGLSLRIGDGRGQLYLTASYTVGFVAFSTNTDQDSIDQIGSLELRWLLPKTTLGLQLGVISDNGTSIDVTDRVERTAYYAGITSNHIVSTKTSFDLNVNYRYTDYASSSLTGYEETQLEGFFNYQVLPKVNLGIGGIVGLLEASPSPDQTYFEPSIRAVWISTGKLTLSATTGVDIRDIDGSSQTRPVFGIEGVYQIRNGTRITLNARSFIFKSAVFTDQNYVGTGVSVSIMQRLTDKCNLVLTGGYENNRYEDAGPGSDASRDDNYYFIRPAIQYLFTDWMGIGIFYEYSQNDSSGAGSRSFRRDRGGLQVNFIY